MNDPEQRGFAPTGRALAVALGVAVLWAAWGLVRHPGFQPAQALRVAAPVLALAVGGGFTQLVARQRRRVDGEREFDRGGKALFMGFVMVAATLVAWLLLSQAVPATVTALAGTARSETGRVVRRVPESDDPACRFRLEVASASAGGGAVPRALDECVAEALWRPAAVGDPVTLQLVGGALGTELTGVGPAAR